MGKKVVKTSNEFQVGDTVFAKLKGYPFWPAKIEEVPNDNGANKKYKILFYGTYETNWLKADVILPFNDETKKQYGNPRKSRSFNDAMWEIENDPGLNMTRRKRNEKRNEQIEEEEEDEDQVQESKEEKEENETITEKIEKADDNENEDKEDEDDEPFIKESKKKKSHQPSKSKTQNAKRKKTSHKKQVEDEEEEAADEPEEDTKKSRRSTTDAKSPITAQEETNSSSETQGLDERSMTKSPSSLRKSKKEKQNRKSIRQKQPNRRYLFDQSDDSNQSRTRNSTQSDERAKVDDVNSPKDEEEINERSEATEDREQEDDDEKSAQTEWSRETSKNFKSSSKSKQSKAKRLYEEKKRALKEKKLAKKKLNLIANIRIQIALIRMDLEIKKSLRVDNTDIERCCLIMQDLLKLPIRAEHLFKTSEIVETTKKCRKFKSSEKIREISNECFTKFSKILNLNAGESFWNEFEKERYKYITSNIDMLRKERSIANKILQEDLRAQKSKASKQTLVNSKRVSQEEEKVAFEEQETPAMELSRSNASKESQENTDQIKSELKDVEEDLKEEPTTTTSQEINKQPDEQNTKIANENEEKVILPTETRTSDEIKS